MEKPGRSFSSTLSIWIADASGCVRSRAMRKWSLVSPSGGVLRSLHCDATGPHSGFSYTANRVPPARVRKCARLPSSATPMTPGITIGPMPPSGVASRAPCATRSTDSRASAVAITSSDPPS